MQNELFFFSSLEFLETMNEICKIIKKLQLHEKNSRNFRAFLSSSFFFFFLYPLFGSIKPKNSFARKKKKCRNQLVDLVEKSQQTFHYHQCMTRKSFFPRLLTALPAIWCRIQVLQLLQLLQQHLAQTAQTTAVLVWFLSAVEHSLIVLAQVLSVRVAAQAVQVQTRKSQFLA